MDSRARFLFLPNRSDQARSIRTRRRGRIGQFEDTDDSGDLGTADTSSGDTGDDGSAPDASSQMVSDFTDLFSGSSDASGMSVSTGNSLVQDADSDADSISPAFFSSALGFFSSDWSSVVGPTGTSGGGSGLGPAASTASSSSMSTSPATPSPLSLFSSIPTWAWLVGAVVVAGVIAAVIQKTGPKAATA